MIYEVQANLSHAGTQLLNEHRNLGHAVGGDTAQRLTKIRRVAGCAICRDEASVFISALDYVA